MIHLCDRAPGLDGTFVDSASADGLRGRRRWNELVDLAQRRQQDLILV